MNLSIAHIDECPLNPRKHFDEDALAELAASIREQGVLQPLTVRPTQHATGAPYELVIGARRLRAAKLAGLDEVPVVCRELHDEEVLEIMLVENAARADVSPLEEADAMLQLSKKFGRDAAYIADRIGRSDDLVRRRLQLADLIPELRALLDTDRIGIGSGELLASLTKSLQAELAAGALSADHRDYQNNPIKWGRHQVRDYIKRASRQLARAPWSLEDEVGDHRACAGCPERSSCQPALLAEFAADEDRCLNAGCWNEKTQAWVQLQRDAGVEILEGDEARAAADQYGRKKSLQPANEKIWLGNKYVKLAELAPDAPRLVALTDAGPVEVVRVADVVAELEEQGKDDVAAKLTGEDGKEQRAADRAKQKAEAEARDEKMAAVVVDATVNFERWLPLMLAGALTELHLDTKKNICSRRDLEVPKVEHYGGTRRDYEGALLEHAESLDVADQFGLLAEVCLRGSVASTWGTSQKISKRVDELLAAEGPKSAAEGPKGAAETSLADRIFAGEIPEKSELEALTVKALRELLVDELDVKRSETTKKSKGELVELVVAYAKTETRCQAARRAKGAA